MNNLYLISGNTTKGNVTCLIVDNYNRVNDIS